MTVTEPLHSLLIISLSLQRTVGLWFTIQGHWNRTSHHLALTSVNFSWLQKVGFPVSGISLDMIWSLFLVSKVTLTFCSINQPWCDTFHSIQAQLHQRKAVWIYTIAACRFYWHLAEPLKFISQLCKQTKTGKKLAATRQLFEKISVRVSINLS